MRKLKKVVRARRPRPEKRLRDPTRCTRAEVIRIKPDPVRPFWVCVRVSPTRSHMRVTARFVSGVEIEESVRGAVVTRSSVLRGTQKVLKGAYTCYMFLNARDLKDAPAEIVSHECGHAAMAWARQQKANLSVIDGEEVMCYALGRMTQNLCNKLDKRGYFAR